jgi:hypothetical protein
MEAIGGEVERRLHSVVPGVEGGAMGLEPYGIDTRIGTLAAGQCAERVEDIG